MNSVSNSGVPERGTTRKRSAEPLHRCKSIAGHQGLFDTGQRPFRGKTGNMYHAFVENSNGFKPFRLQNRSERSGQNHICQGLEAYTRLVRPAPPCRPGWHPWPVESGGYRSGSAAAAVAGIAVQHKGVFTIVPDDPCRQVGGDFSAVPQTAARFDDIVLQQLA